MAYRPFGSRNAPEGCGGGTAPEGCEGDDEYDELNGHGHVDYMTATWNSSRPHDRFVEPSVTTWRLRGIVRDTWMSGDLADVLHDPYARIKTFPTSTQRSNGAQMCSVMGY